jgi:hypothetical protein
MLIIQNTFSHIFICMLDKFIKTMILVLHSNQKIFLYPPKVRILKLTSPNYWRGIYLCLKLLNAHAIPLLEYIRNSLGSITYFKNFRGVLQGESKVFWT